MSAARRSLLTATAAGSLLGALWFVPSADATVDKPTVNDQQTPATTATTTATDPADDQGLADTGSVDTTPYLIGGTLFLGLGAGFVAYAARRERTAAY